MGTPKVHLTEATKRANLPQGVALDGANVETNQRYASRQAKSYDPSKLFQYKVPDLTVQDLLSSIPKHCFERSAFRSSLYLFADFIQVAALVYCATWIDTISNSIHFSNSFVMEETVQRIVSYGLWILYGVYQGFVFTGIWVIAHECGHQAFSSSKNLNNSVGWVLHSALLVPYHSWRISHARHHAGTGHMQRDEVFVPRTREDRGMLPLRPADENNQADSQETFGEWLTDMLEDAPLFNFVELLIQQLFGWPLYLLCNTSGQMKMPKWTNRASNCSHQTFLPTRLFLISATGTRY